MGHESPLSRPDGGGHGKIKKQLDMWSSVIVIYNSITRRGSLELNGRK